MNGAPDALVRRVEEFKVPGKKEKFRPQRPELDTCRILGR